MVCLLSVNMHSYRQVMLNVEGEYKKHNRQLSNSCRQ